MYTFYIDITKTEQYRNICNIVIYKWTNNYTIPFQIHTTGSMVHKIIQT